MRHPDLVRWVTHEVPAGHAYEVLRREIEHLAAIDLREHALPRGRGDLIQPTDLVVRAVWALRYLELHGSVLLARVSFSGAPRGRVPQAVGVANVPGSSSLSGP